jgi:hypothetical protein
MNLSDEELRAELFRQLVGRSRAAADDDPTITVSERGSAAFAVRRHGDELIIHAGAGKGVLLSGQLTWEHRSDRDDQDAPWEFRLERVPGDWQRVKERRICSARVGQRSKRARPVLWPELQALEAVL